MNISTSKTAISVFLSVGLRLQSGIRIPGGLLKASRKTPLRPVCISKVLFKFITITAAGLS